MAFWNKKKDYEVVDIEQVRAPGPTEPELDVVEEVEITSIFTPPEVEEPKVNWIWVEGYKAVFSDMTAKKGDIVYEVGKTYEMSPDLVKECEGGYHLCRRLKDTFEYYSPFEDNKKTIRYYKVKALVPEDKWNELPKKDTDVCKTIEKLYHSYSFNYKIKVDKIAACAICFLEEVDLNTIMHAIVIENPASYHAQYIDLAKEFYRSHDFNQRTANEFYAYILSSECGFSDNMSKYLVQKNQVAEGLAFGTQPGLSIQEKLQFLFNKTITIN